MYEQISPDTSHIRYEETDLSYLKLRPYRFKCGIYLICIQQCSKAETCLRQLAERLSPEELISCSAINPKHLAKFKNECPYFCSNKQVRYARGFLGILENLTSKQTHFFINRVISNSSRRTYYRVRNGERALSPAEQQNIINILKECGVTFSIEFDSYFEDYYWSNTL